MTLDQPAEAFMQAGGDLRQTVDPSTGLTKYRVAPTPRPGVPLGSCTASWPSRRAFAAVEEQLEAWREAASPEDAVADTCDGVGDRLRDVFGISRDVAVALHPSGTDAVYLVTALALRWGADHVHHVVVGASELGGGTLTAARGKAFSPLTPLAGQVEPGAPVDGLHHRCTAEPVYLRDRRGRRLEPAVVDADVRQRVDAALARGSTAVVHLVAHSKTGLRAPSMHCVRELFAQHGDRVRVLVDAAQGRVAPRDVRHALQAGCMVLFTGSKFYCGPPFSGVLLLPEPFSVDPGPLPAGLAGWLARHDLPAHWTQAQGSLPDAANPGLALRWVAALTELEAYHGIPQRRRSRVFHTFSGSMMEAFGPSERLELDVPMPPVHALASGLGAFPTVFGFRVKGPAGWLAAPQLRRLHALLDTELGGDPVMQRRFHLGQPVAMGPPQDGAPAVLRAALGARLVTELADHADGGAGYFREVMGQVRAKAERLLDDPAAGLG